MDLSTKELATLLSWYDSIINHCDPWLLAKEHYELKEKLKKELLGY